MANATRNKRSRHTGAKVTGAAVIIAALLAGGHFGLGIGRGEGGALLPNQEAPAAQTAVAETAEETTEAAPAENPADDGVLGITVREDGVYYEGEAVTLDELGEALLKDWKDGVGVTLTDDHAIKSTYDEVTALLDKLSIPYTAE